MKIDSDRSRVWWRRFDPDDLIEAEELIDFVMYHKVQASSEYTTDQKNDILVGWERVQKALWGDEHS
jgi:hypothetical protein